MLVLQAPAVAALAEAICLINSFSETFASPLRLEVTASVEARDIRLIDKIEMIVNKIAFIVVSFVRCWFSML